MNLNMGGSRGEGGRESMKRKGEVGGLWAEEIGERK